MSSRPVLFVSDLHLAATRPAATATFLSFLGREAREASQLYILGDLFDAWIGDDDQGDDHNEAVLTGIAALARTGVAIRIMHGNRDFLVGAAAVERARAVLIEDPTQIDLFGRRTVLLHGDTLCTDDERYQAFRARVRSPTFATRVLRRPLWMRRAFARYLRMRSILAKRTKTMELMDVNMDAVEALFRSTRCELMIHGHTHRPARHEHWIDGTRHERVVLADWYGKGGFLRCLPGRIDAVALG